MSYLFVNGCRDRLLGGILAADAQLRLVSDETFPDSIPSGRVLALTLHAEGLPGVQEIVYCTAISGGVLTVQRAREGTSARDWRVGTVVGAYFTAGMADAFGGNAALDRLDIVEAFLAGVQAGANYYVHPSSHPASMIEQDENHLFLTVTEKSQALQSIVLGETEQNAYRADRGKQAWDHSRAAHAPATAQKNSDITKDEIEARLTGVISSHGHAYLPLAWLAEDMYFDAALYVRGAASVIGYGNGSGGTVTQGVSKSMGVTLNKGSGAVTMHAAPLSGGAVVSFVLNNNLISAMDVLEVGVAYNSVSNSSFYNVWASAYNGGAVVCLKNITGGSLSENVVLNFAVMKGYQS